MIITFQSRKAELNQPIRIKEGLFMECQTKMEGRRNFLIESSVPVFRGMELTNPSTRSGEHGCSVAVCLNNVA